MNTPLVIYTSGAAKERKRNLSVSAEFLFKIWRAGLIVPGAVLYRSGLFPSCGFFYSPTHGACLCISVTTIGGVILHVRESELFLESPTSIPVLGESTWRVDFHEIATIMAPISLVPKQVVLLADTHVTVELSGRRRLRLGSIAGIPQGDSWTVVKFSNGPVRNVVIVTTSTSCCIPVLDESGSESNILEGFIKSEIITTGRNIMLAGVPRRQVSDAIRNVVRNVIDIDALVEAYTSGTAYPQLRKFKFSNPDLSLSW